jgi:tetratricopeptide (TPR) repeat protein
VPPELEAQRIQLLDLWAEANRAACAEQPLLLVVDGMDEMALGAVTIADLLPTELGPYVHVLVSSRPNPVPMQQVWPEHPLRAAVVLPLHELESVEMSALLVRQGSAPEVALALADRMVEVTGGEPLLSRFVAQDVAAGGEDMLERLERDPPAGVRDYFLRQFSQLDARAAGRTAWDVLGLLLVARGGMALEDLAAVLDMPVRNVNHAIEPIRRFLLGNDRLELMHDEFRVVLTANFSPRERAEYRRRLRHWSASFGAAGWPDDTPDYVLDSYAALLREEDLHEALYALIDQRWMQLRAARTGSYHAFAQDILLMIAAAAAKTPPDLGQQLRGVHIYVTLGSMARSLPAVALGVLARAGHVTLAEGYADLINEADAKSSAYCHVATGLVRRGEIREAVEAIRRALVAAEAISLEELQVQALAQVAATMAEAGRPEQASDPIALALGAAEAISTEDRRIQALAQVAAAMADVGQGEQAALFAEEALEAIEADPDLYDNQAVLGAVAVVLAKTGQVAQAVDLAARARAAASSFPDDSLRSVVLALINTGHSAEAEILAGRARAAAEEIIDDSFRAGALAEVAVALAEAGQAPQAVAVAEDARRLAEVSSGWLGNSVLERVALALATVGQGELACAAANAIPSDSHRSQALAAVAGALADGGSLVQAVELAKETLAATEAIPSEETRSRALAQTIKDLAAAGQVENAVALAERVRNLAEAVPDRQFRAEALAELAVMLAEMRQTKSASSLCEEVLDLARAIRYDESRVQVHAKMVSVLGMTGQLDRAVALAETIGSAAAGISSHWSRARALTAVAVGLANAGQPERASVLAEQAMIAAQAEHGSSRALEEVTAALARTGLVEHALEAAEAIPSDWARTRALAKVAVALAREGRPEQVMVLANRIRILTETMPDDWFAVEALAGAVAALAAAGQAVQAVHFAEQANRLAEGIAYKDSRVRILAQLASAMISLGRVERAAALAKDALQVAEHIPEVAGVRALMDAAGILARAGQAEQAQTVASRAMTPTAVTDRFAFFDLLPLVLRVIRTAEGDATTQVDMAGVVVETERWWSVSSDVIPEVNLEI